LLVKGSPEKVQWSTRCDDSLREIQRLLSSSPILIIPDMREHFIVRSDASDRGIGAMLLQEKGSILMPCRYASRKLNQREARNSDNGNSDNNNNNKTATITTTTMSFSGSSIFVTGASRGIGLEFIKQLVELPSAPDLVIAACRDPSSATNLRDIARSHPTVKIIKLDVNKDEDIDTAFQETQTLVGDKGLNILVHNAAINDKTEVGGIYEATRERMQQHFNANVSGPIMITQKFLPLIKKAVSLKVSKEPNNEAAIVVISSVKGSQNLAFTEGRGTRLHYKCSKTAINMATILMARELRETGIVVSALHPGSVRTAMGGPNAPLSETESVASCLQRIASMSEKTHGKLVNWDGEILPY
ncbi:C-factor, partial [Elysia marginata]